MAGSLLLRRSLSLFRTLDQVASSSHPLGLPLSQCKQLCSAADSEVADDSKAEKKQRSPDAWRARIPADMRKHGLKLKEDDMEAFERMRILLGYYEQPPYKTRQTNSKISKVTISNLQTLRYMGFEPTYKFALLRYKMNTLNRELKPVVNDTKDILSKLKSGQGSIDFVPSLPGMTAAESS